ncbi:hypothetical protein R3Q06_31555 [Rhodococcus erythropolis]|uniref:hypothetical protein n=1 Tax=Rhodococcus erythropolis TaxID=1833 RepID=UPI0029498752|nr:hypothetical protein [Rhodococcus erythropolis]MDV6278023.1 hypothetical protein [Rhodococcus erythropolis]
MSVRDYGWPTEPPHQIDVGARTYLHPHAQPEIPEPRDSVRDLGTITPVPPFGRFPVLAQQGSESDRPTTVYLRWWNGKYYSYGLSGGR